ncbi:GNAT family N-acetyltransferase [Companilactobacillus kimchiensis]|uniref:Gnat family acetyltransferase n=1 Tax=Companilactobacillus kimchiensis TaxID=993692 RepID=A0A0R2LK01_9LACO|nr:GNAT family protein [Companilactobacillus kimchiensis]KRN99335.1 gnat family acetyltransferase [Companilactobacillus kimchiensis]
MAEVKIRQLQPEEVEEFWQTAFSDPNADWTKLNGPYFHDDLPSKEEFINVLAYKNWINNQEHLVITYDDKIVGSVGAHFKDGDLKRWIDMGITIYPKDMWDKHIGSQALKLFIEYLFKTYDFPHVGLTTWSGNPRMMHVAQKVGMKEEACIRQVRYYEGKYYDSMQYGILRDELQSKD